MNGGGGGGGGGGGRVSKLGVTLVIVFAIALLVIFAQVFYVLWRRLVFRRRTNAGGGSGGEEASRYSSSDSALVAPSKELLYFFCVRPQFRLDGGSLTADSGGEGRNSIRKSDVEVIDIDLLTIQGAFGPPRFLFTIEEEEREGVETPAKETPCPSEIEVRQIVGEEERGSVSFEDSFLPAEETAAAAAEVEVEIDDGSVDDGATPFSTPCASPVYFTPSASPARETVNCRSIGVATA